MTEQEKWLDDHPDKTAADFVRLSARAAVIGDGGNAPIESYKAGEQEVMHFQAWQEMQRIVAKGGIVRLGDGTYRKIGPTRR